MQSEFKICKPKVLCPILIKIWATGFTASLAIIALIEAIPHGGWPEGILFYIGLLFFFPLSFTSMVILKAFWSPDYLTSDGMPIIFWIISICINWLALLCSVYFLSLFFNLRKAKGSDGTWGK